MEQTLTEEQKKDSEVRLKSFNEDYTALIEKLQVELFAYPQLVPTSTGQFVIQVMAQAVDKKYLPKPSPYNEKVIK